MSSPRTAVVVREALTPPAPGRAVRVLSSVSRGVAMTRAQINDYAAAWAEAAEREIGCGTDGHRLIAVGDSLAQGIGASTVDRSFVSRVATGWSEILGEPISTINLSRSGARMADVIRVQLPAAQLLAANGDATVICMVGSNDLLRSARFNRTLRRVDELTSDLPAGSVIGTLPAHGSLLAKVANRRLRTSAERNGLAVADVGAALTSWKGRLAGDGFHPNDAGHQLWAEVFLQALADRLHHSELEASHVGKP